MPRGNGLLHLHDPNHHTVLDRLEVSDPHVWDEDSMLLYDHAPPLPMKSVLDDFGLGTTSSHLTTHTKNLKRQRPESLSSTADGVSTVSSRRGFSHASKSMKDIRLLRQDKKKTEKEDQFLIRHDGKQKPKHYKKPTASKFCHICGRKSCKVTMAVCSRIEEGLCRKVICEHCFTKYNYDRRVIEEAKRIRAKGGKDADVIKQRKTYWECPHCTGKCVPKAQCNTYGKTNYKRHLKLRSRRSEKEGKRESAGYGGSSRRS